MRASTQYQRAEIIRLLRKLEFDTRTVTYQHRKVDDCEFWIGMSVDGWLSSMTQERASKAIDRLRKMQ